MTPDRDRQADRARDRANRENWVQLVQFGVVGVSGYVVNLTVFAVLTGAASSSATAATASASTTSRRRSLAFCVAVTNNFCWNRHWTFDAKHGHAGFQAARFFTVSVARARDQPGRARAADLAADVPELPAQAIAVAVRDALQLHRQQALDLRRAASGLAALALLRRAARGRRPRSRAARPPTAGARPGLRGARRSTIAEGDANAIEATREHPDLHPSAERRPTATATGRSASSPTTSSSSRWSSTTRAARSRSPGPATRSPGRWRAATRARSAAR